MSDEKESTSDDSSYVQYRDSCSSSVSSSCAMEIIPRSKRGLSVGSVGSDGSSQLGLPLVTVGQQLLLVVQ